MTGNQVGLLFSDPSGGELPLQPPTENASPAEAGGVRGEECRSAGVLIYSYIHIHT